MILRQNRVNPIKRYHAKIVCLFYTSQISPHDKKFSTDCVHGIRDKYQVWQQPNSSGEGEGWERGGGWVSDMSCTPGEEERPQTEGSDKYPLLHAAWQI